MARVVITLDTETGEHEVKAGDVALENVSEVHIGCGMLGAADESKPYCYIEISQCWTDKSDGMRRYVRLTADEKNSDLIDKTINHKSLAEHLFPKYAEKLSKGKE